MTTSSRKLIAKADFARLRGVSPAAVTRAIKSGRITAAVVTRGGRELLDQALAVDLWERNTLQREAAADLPDLNESRRRLLHHRAELAELEAGKARGDLVPVAEVRSEAFQLGRSLRDALMVIPDRLAPTLACTTDPRQCHLLLSEEIRVALRALAAGG